MCVHENILTVSSVHTIVLYLVPEQLIEKRMQCIELFIGVNSQLHQLNILAHSDLNEKGRWE